MSSFWDESNLTHCAGPPGVPPGGTGDGFQPNCWAGMASRNSLNAARYPRIALGLDNYSFEFWYRPETIFGGAGFDDDVDVGFWVDGAPPTSTNGPGVWWKYPDGESDVYWFVSAPVDLTGGGDAISKWNHHVINVDRAGNLSYYRNAVLFDADNIAGAAANNLGTAVFAAWIGADNDVNAGWDDWHDDDLTEWDFGHFNGIIGPVAVNVGGGSLLTVAEMRTSMERRYVNLSATTVLLYDWRTPQEVVGWDGDRTHIIRGISDYATNPIAAAEGADGTIVVPDLSGNGNDFTLTTREAYNTLVPAGALWNDWTVIGLSGHAFASDPFFKHGGLS